MDGPEDPTSNIAGALGVEPTWTPAEIGVLELPGDGTLTAIITGLDGEAVSWRVDYRVGDTVQTVGSRQESSRALARQTAWGVMQIVLASLLEE